MEPLAVERELVRGLARVDGEHAGAHVLSVQRSLRPAQLFDVIHGQQTARAEKRARAECPVDEYADRGLERRDIADVADTAYAQARGGQARIALQVQCRQ